MFQREVADRIIANDNEGLQMISACSTGAKVRVSDIKYLSSSKVFLLSIERTKIEGEQNNKKINFLGLGYNTTLTIQKQFQKLTPNGPNKM